ncbi:hypothetical protein A3SI_09747 [Nitritalea halalkaliphila LW7]|uniref:LamB/YcsF family protein n=1 Tax=Nitritalea halalkaliphila LW7 TaxID=1189621 RepID=I5C3S1_9BACT|nr:LamB/YcsF family protein [Nitritalea halalkaliphila]EIM76473.1 hypothetical protein A3SI_09747 [Nitritalea halalkaliphila LW7]
MKQGAIKLNCDMGEGLANDAQLMPFLDFANISCGAHAGDEAAARLAMREAQKHGVGIGAHPGYPDRAHFGRRSQSLDSRALVALLDEQMEHFTHWLSAERATLHHIKLHGALYHDVAFSPLLAETFIRWLQENFPGIPVFGPPQGDLFRLARAHKMPYLREGFLDRHYAADGKLLPRCHPQALLQDIQAMEQRLTGLRSGKIRTLSGTVLAVQFETLCLHGDHPLVLHFARTAAQFRDA